MWGSGVFPHGRSIGREFDFGSVGRDPMPGDVDPAADPDVVVFLNMVQEALERLEASGAAGEAAV